MGALDRKHARRRVAALLGAEERIVAWEVEGEELELELAKATDLERMQVGYAVSSGGESLLASEGGWQPQWFVIGFEVLLGDPVFVDLDQSSLPAFTAMHGMGTWEAQALADSLEEFLGQA